MSVVPTAVVFGEPFPLCVLYPYQLVHGPPRAAAGAHVRHISLAASSCVPRVSWALVLRFGGESMGRARHRPLLATLPRFVAAELSDSRFHLPLLVSGTVAAGAPYRHLEPAPGKYPI